MNHQKTLATILTLAGSDPSGGAGVQADCKTIHALGGYALSVTTALTTQNSQGVQAVYQVDPNVFAAQVDALLADYQIDALKIGMLGNADKVEQLSGILQQIPVNTPIILDPVLISSSGKTLLQNNAIAALLEKVIPLVTVLTPNIPEAEFLLAQSDIEIELNDLLSQQEFKTIAKALQQLKCNNILLKGGHGCGDQAIDYLFTELQSKPQIHSFAQPRIQVQHSHGTGCTLSSAIATKLAQGNSIEQAVAASKDYLHQALLQSATGQPHYRPLSEAKNEKSHRSGGLHHFFAK
jgi:hydroxymethylpyrimidine/phosphomethylpyrimidine kinase